MFGSSSSQNWKGPHAPPEIHSIVALSNQTDSFTKQLTDYHLNFYYYLQSFFSYYYKYNLEDPYYSTSLKYIVENLLQPYVANLFVLSNTVETAIEDLDKMVKFMEADMKKEKDSNMNLTSGLIISNNEKKSSTQLVTDTIVNYKVQKFELFFYLVGLVYLLYFIVHKIFKISIPTSSAAAAATVATVATVANVGKAAIKNLEIKSIPEEKSIPDEKSIPEEKSKGENKLKTK